jgi:predicted lipoprotein with Yx(FWY)xxD motif
MRPSLKFLPVAIAASIGLAACGSSSSGSGAPGAATGAASTRASASSSGATSTGSVTTASNATLGATVLTDARGMTLYSLSAERNGRFICTSSACVGVWHPLSASAGSQPNSGVASLAAVKRPDGSKQVTYKGMPLYTFAEDRQPGDAKGQGLKDVGTWTAVTLAGASEAGAPASTQTQPAPAAPAAPAGGGYGY